jgi:hypothetical protein
MLIFAALTPACSSPPTWRCATRCGAFGDERRIVAADEGGRVRTRSDHPVPQAMRRLQLPRSNR